MLATDATTLVQARSGPWLLAAGLGFTAILSKQLWPRLGIRKIRVTLPEGVRRRQGAGAALLIDSTFHERAPFLFLVISGEVTGLHVNTHALYLERTYNNLPKQGLTF